MVIVFYGFFFFPQHLLKYLQDESLDKKKKPFVTSGWKTENVQVGHF